MNELDLEVVGVRISSDRLALDLVDGRSISVPLAFYPTLLLASEQERQTYEVNGASVYWPLLDCDIGSAGLLLGAKELPVYARQAYARRASKEPAA
jgi:hypothetical protein